MGGDDDESHGPRFLLPLWIRGEPTLPRPDHTHSYFLTRELLVGVLSSRRKLERLSALFLPEAHQPRALCLRSRPVSRDDLADIRAGRLPVAVEEVCTGHNALKLCGGVGGHVATFALATPLHRLKTSSAVPRKLGLSELQVDLPGSMILQLSITQHNAIDDGTRLQIDAVVRRPYLAVRELDELPPAEVAGRFLTFVFSVYQPSQQDSCPLLRNVSSLDALPDWLDIDEALEEEDAQCALRELVMLEIDAC